MGSTRYAKAMLSVILGGARSGKSELAELQACEFERSLGQDLAQMRKGFDLVPKVTYLATGKVTDGEMAVRIDAHRRRRPQRWETLEITGVSELISSVFRTEGVILIDSLGSWLAGLESYNLDYADIGRALRLRKGHSVVVSEEVGLGVHPSYQSGMAFRDALGDLNRYIAGLADQVWFVVAGIPMKIGGLDSKSS